MSSRRTNNFPENGHGLGHVTPTIFLAVRSAILATAWLLVSKAKVYGMDKQDRWMGEQLMRLAKDEG